MKSGLITFFTIKSGTYCPRPSISRKIGGSVLLGVMLSLSMVSSVRAQGNIQFTQGAVGTGLDNTLSVPLRSYPGRGAASLPISLYYSSRVWRLDNLATVSYGSDFQTIVQAIYAEHSTSGWKTSLDLPIIEWPKETDEYKYTGDTYCYTCGESGTAHFRVARVYIHMPDGSRHELRESDQPYQGSIDMSGTFYAVDGSRMRYDSTGANTGTLYMPDGTRYILNGSTSQYIDRNGNTLNYNASARQWTDTLGRPIGMPWPANPQAGQDYSYQLPGFTSNTSVTYTLRWKYLADALTPDPNTGQPPTRKRMTNDYLPSPSLPPTGSTGNNYPISLGGVGSTRPSLFISAGDGVSEGPDTIVVGKGQAYDELFNPVVLTEIILPNGLSYEFSYNIYGELNKIVYPTGAYETYQLSEVTPGGTPAAPFSETSRGVTSRKLSANGTGNDLVESTYTTPGGTITSKSPNDHANGIYGTQTESIRQFYEAPEHGVAHPKRYWAFGFDDARNGTSTDDRVYALNSDGTRGAMLRRSLTKYEQTSNSVTPRLGGISGDVTETAYRNVRSIKAVSLMLDTGSYALAKTMTSSYDSTYQLTTGLDLLTSTESQFADVDQTTAQTAAIDTISSGSGTIVRSAETTYLNSTSYRDRNILGLPIQAVVKDASGNVVSKNEVAYDETTLLTYGDLTSVTDYTNPNTTVRGNVTTSRRFYDIANGLYLEGHAEFDQCGNMISATDERGIQSQVAYSSDYKHAFATLATTAIPDTSGTHSSNAAFTSSTTFNTRTGVPLSVTDANGQVTNFSYQDDQGAYDPLNRLRKVTRPDGGWSKTIYHDVKGTVGTTAGLFTYSETQMEGGRTTFGYQFFDALGRAVRSQSYAGGTGFLTSDTQYDKIGRAYRTSNPYTTTLGGSVNPSGKWTTVTGYDAFNRATQVTLPDSTTVATSYSGIYTTATDQAGRQRRKKTDALGRIVRVDEPDPDSSGSLGSVDSPNLASYYTYDTLGNIIRIQQGKSAALQNRYFKYDALGRLTRERQVEAVANSNFTQSDSLTNNSSWTRKLVYDETISGVSYKGLLTTMYDARGISSQFKHDQLNRITQVSYSDRTPAVTNNYDQAHTGYFNKGKLTEVITASVSDDSGTSYDDSVPETCLKYDFDLMGRTVKSSQSVDSNVYNLAYKYNLGGQMTQETYPSGRVVNFGFDEASRLSNVNGGQSHVYADAFIYAGHGAMSSFTMGNGATISLGYGTNGRLQLSDLTLARNGTTLQKYQYTYGQIASGSVDTTKNNGQLAQVESWIGTEQQYREQFSYDSLGRLSESVEKYGTSLASTAYDVKYRYDVFGNREQRSSDNSGNTSITQKWVEAGDISTGNNRYSSGVTYDVAGNITADPRFRNLTYGYDANGRQNYAATANGSGPITAIFDGAGQRVANRAGGVMNIMVYDAGGKLVAEYGATAPTTTNLQYVTADYQGSTRVVTNTSGAVVNRHDYLPFGEDIGAGVGSRTIGKSFSQVDSVRQKYAGMETDDATGMATTLWRKQDNLSGRWTSPDPYGGSMTLADPQSFNRYTYCNNDPVNQVDPSGLYPSDYHDADSGWQDVSGYFWGTGGALYGGRSFGGSHMSNAQASHDSRVNQAMASRDLRQAYSDGASASSGTFIDPAEIAFVGYFDENGLLTWLFGVPYTLPSESVEIGDPPILSGTITPKLDEINKSRVQDIGTLIGGTMIEGGRIQNNTGTTYVDAANRLNSIGFEEFWNPFHDGQSFQGRVGEDWFHVILNESNDSIIICDVPRCRYTRNPMAPWTYMEGHSHGAEFSPQYHWIEMFGNWTVRNFTP